MILYLLDSSAIVKRYVAEPGSAWVRDLMIPAADVDLRIAAISRVEVVAAISRIARMGAITAPQASSFVAQFRRESASEMATVDLSPSLLDAAMDLAVRHGLRGYDAVQLAVALDLSETARKAGVPMTFVTADRELLGAALAEGLAVEDPNAHP